MGRLRLADDADAPPIGSNEAKMPIAAEFEKLTETAPTGASTGANRF
jgi:hypothetical protein